MPSAIVVLAAGIALLLVSELAALAPMRILAVALLAGGGVGAGVAAGLRPRTKAMPERVAGIASRAAIFMLALILAAPLLAVLMAALVGAATRLFDANSAVNMPLVIAGGVVGLLLLAATILALVAGIGAIRGNAPDHAAQEQG